MRIVNAETKEPISGINLFQNTVRLQPAMNSEHALSSLVTAIRKVLVQEREAQVPGLGTFRVSEQTSRLESGPDGRITVTPFVRIITFSPNKADRV